MFSQTIAASAPDNKSPSNEDLEPGAGSQLDELQGLLSRASQPIAQTRPTCARFFRSLIPACCRRTTIQNDEQPGLPQP